MKLYRTTRYGSTGRLVWQRYGTSQNRYGAAVGNLYGRNKVTLEVMEIDETQFKQIKTAGKVPE